jgi:hypothetical protein
MDIIAEFDIILRLINATGLKNSSQMNVWLVKFFLLAILKVFSEVCLEYKKS